MRQGCEGFPLLATLPLSDTLSRCSIFLCAACGAHPLPSPAHPAPTQHVSEYSVAMIMGAGIGATPVSATLKSVVFHRWKYFIGQCFPDHAYFYWVCAHRDIDAFRWLIRNIKDAQDEVMHMRANSPQQMASKTCRCSTPCTAQPAARRDAAWRSSARLIVGVARTRFVAAHISDACSVLSRLCLRSPVEFHIFVTSVPKGTKPIDVIIGEEDEIGFWGKPMEDAKVEKVRANWDEADLYRTMKCPAAHTQLQDVHIWVSTRAWRTAITQRRCELAQMLRGQPLTRFLSSFSLPLPHLCARMAGGPTVVEAALQRRRRQAQHGRRRSGLLRQQNDRERPQETVLPAESEPNGRILQAAQGAHQTHCVYSSGWLSFAADPILLTGLLCVLFACSLSRSCRKTSEALAPLHRATDSTRTRTAHGRSTSRTRRSTVHRLRICSPLFSFPFLSFSNPCIF